MSKLERNSKLQFRYILQTLTTKINNKYLTNYNTYNKQTTKHLTSLNTKHYKQTLNKQPNLFSHLH